MRDEQAGGRVVAVCNELTAASRSALLDGTIDLVLGTPIAAIAQRTVELLDRAVSGTDTGVTQILLPAELFVGENI